MASSSLENEKMGDLITAAMGMSCLGLSKSDSKDNMVSTSMVSKYPVSSVTCAGMPKDMRVSISFVPRPFTPLISITISEYRSGLWPLVSLSYTKNPAISSLMRKAIILPSASKLSSKAKASPSSPSSSSSEGSFCASKSSVV